MVKNQYLCTMRQKMETIEILSAKLRNAEADRDRFKEQADRNFRDKEEYRQMYEQAKSQAQLDKMESMMSQILSFITGNGNVSLAESITNPIIKAVEDKYKAMMRDMEERHKEEMRKQAEQFAIERRLYEQRISALEKHGGDDDNAAGGVDMSMTDGKFYATKEEALAALERERNKNANLVEDRYAQTTECNRYCGRPSIDADSADNRGEDVKEDVFDETAVVSAINRAAKMMQADSRRQRPRSTQPLESSEDPMRREDVWLEPDDVPEGAKYMGNEDVVKYIVVKSYVKAIHYHLKSYMKDNVWYKAKRKPHLIPKCNAEASLIAYVLYQHYANRMTFGMLVKELADMGYNMKESTLKNWVAMGADKLEPLMEPLQKEITSDDRLQADETHVDVESQKEEETKSHYHNEWMYNFINPIKKLCQYIYKDGDRGAYVVVDYLNGRDKVKQLFLNADGAKMYETFHEGHSNEAENVVHIPCASHMRRKFWNLRKVEPDAKYVADLFDDLFRLCRKFKDDGLSPGEIKDERLKEFSEILQKIANKLDELSVNREQFRHADLYEAVDYTRRLWPYFMIVLQRGDVSIDNNLCEQQMRPIAIYRNNSLFCGSHKGAERLANVMSLIQSCRLLKVNVYDYLCDVLNRIADFTGDLMDLLPHRWKPATVLA